MRGRVTVKYKDEKGDLVPLTFHFGLWVIERLELAFNAQLTEMYDTGNKDENDKPIIESKFLTAISDQPYKFSATLLYWGRYFVYEQEEKEIDFNLSDAYLWIDYLGLNSKEMNSISECFNDSLRSHLPKGDYEPEVKKKSIGQKKSGLSAWWIWACRLMKPKQ